MFRTTSVLLTAVGFLICPYVCLGETGGLCIDEASCRACQNTPSCCTPEDGVFAQAGDEIPQPCDGCQHECVLSKSTIETSQKTPREITQSIFDSVLVDFMLVDRHSSSIDFETELRKHVSPQRSVAGWQLRVTLASLLL